MTLGFSATEPFLKPMSMLLSAQAFKDASSFAEGKYRRRVDVAKLPVYSVILQRWSEMRNFSVAHHVPWPLEATLQGAFAEWSRVCHQAGIWAVSSTCPLDCFRKLVFKSDDSQVVKLIIDTDLGSHVSNVAVPNAGLYSPVWPQMNLSTTTPWTPTIVKGRAVGSEPKSASGKLQWLAPFNPGLELAIDLDHPLPTFQNANFGCNASLLGAEFAKTKVPGFLSLENCIRTMPSFQPIWDYPIYNGTGLTPQWQTALAEQVGVNCQLLTVNCQLSSPLTNLTELPY
jgi:hypothetical protein